MRTLPTTKEGKPGSSVEASAGVTEQNATTVKIEVYAAVTYGIILPWQLADCTLQQPSPKAKPLRL
jgi:hypothetical protein